MANVLSEYKKSVTYKKILINTMVLFLIISLVLPIINLFSKSFFKDGVFVGLENFIVYFSTPALFKSLTNSLFVSIVTSIIIVFLAFVFAYGVERTNVKFKFILQAIALLPLFIPTMTHAIALIYLLGENGIITNGFFGLLPNLQISFPLYGKWGIIIAESIYVFPAIFMMFSVAFKIGDYRLYEAADILGSGNIKKFFTVTLPSVKYTVISAFFASFTMVFSDFGIPKVLGGNYNVLATDIYKQVVGQANITMGATVGMLLLIPSIISFIVDRVASKKVSSVDSSAKPYITNKNKVRDMFVGFVMYFICIVILLIIGTVIMAAFTKQWPYDRSFTLKWFSINSVGVSPIQIYINTLFVSLFSAIIGTILVLFTAYVTERGGEHPNLRKFLDWLGILPLALPGLVVGLSYLLYFNEQMNSFNFIYGSFIILVLSNVIHFFSVPYMTIKTNMKKIDMEYENVSEVMGVPWYIAFDRVILPLSMGSVIEGFVYYFLNSMMTTSAIVFLYTNKTKIASIEMLARYDEGDIASTAAIAVLILITNMLFKFALNKYLEHRRKKVEI